MISEKDILVFEQVTKWHRYGKISANRIDWRLKGGAKMLLYSREEEGLADLFDLSAGLAPPDEGKVYRSKKMAFIPGRFPYMENLNVMDYLMLPLLTGGKGKKEAYGQVESMLEGSALERKGTVKAQFLSGLEKCELMLMMACIGEPDGILIGDCSRYLSRESEKVFWQYVGIRQEEYKCAVLAFSGFRDIPFGFQEIYELSEGKLCRR